MAQIKEYEDLFVEMFNNLVPSSGKAKTILGDLLRIEENLYYEASTNGNANWYVGRRDDALYLINNFEMVKSYVKSQSNFDKSLHFLKMLKTYTEVWTSDLQFEDVGVVPEEVKLFLDESVARELDEYYSCYLDRDCYDAIMKCLIDMWISVEVTELEFI